MKTLLRSLCLLLAFALLGAVVIHAEEDEPLCDHVLFNTIYHPNYDGTHTAEDVCVCGLFMGSFIEPCSDWDGNNACDLCFAMEECPHIHFETTLTSTGYGQHITQTVCTDCGASMDYGYYEFCMDMDNNLRCDVCGGRMACQHNERQRVYTPIGGGRHEFTNPCSFCDNISSRYTESCTDSNEDSLCNLCGAKMPFAIAGTNMTLGNELKLNFMIPAASLDTSATYRAKITHGDNVAWVELGRYNALYYSAAYSVCAKQMADPLTAQIFDQDGKAVSLEYTSSICDYAMRILDNSAMSAQIKTLVVDMLLYGASAQEYFDYNTHDPASGLLSDAQLAMATPDVPCTNLLVKGANCAGSNLSLEDRILLNMMFSGLRGADVSEMYATIRYTDYTGADKSFTVPGSDFGTYGIYKSVTVDQIVLADASQPVTVTVCNADGSVYGEGTDSVESYVARVDGALYRTIMNFAASAKSFLQ